MTMASVQVSRLPLLCMRPPLPIPIVLDQPRVWVDRFFQRARAPVAACYAIAERTVARIFSIAVFRFSSALLAQ